MNIIDLLKENVKNDEFFFNQYSGANEKENTEIINLLEEDIYINYINKDGEKIYSAEFVQFDILRIIISGTNDKETLIKIIHNLR